MRTLHLCLRVTNLEKSIAFYEAVGYEVLGGVPATETCQRDRSATDRRRVRLRPSGLPCGAALHSRRLFHSHSGIPTSVETASIIAAVISSTASNTRCSTTDFSTTLPYLDPLNMRTSSSHTPCKASTRTQLCGR